MGRVKTLRQAVRRQPHVGAALPQPWRNLSRLGVEFRRGELTLVAAQPASGKSAFALATVALMRVPALYLCPDTSARSMLTRLASMMFSLPYWESRDWFDRDPEDLHARLAEAVPNLRWEFDVDSLAGIDDELAAWSEVFGDGTLQLLVVDNLTDIVVADGEGHWQAMRDTLVELKKLARQHEIAVMCLHHVGETKDVKEEGAPRSRDIAGKDTKAASTVLTMGMDSGGVVSMACVKNRDSGKSDKNAEFPVTFRFDGPRMTFSETLWDPYGE